VTAPAALDLPARSRSSREARRWVAERLADMGLDHLVDAVELLTAEIVTNALLHAGTPLTLRVRREGTGVHVEVHDGSPVPPRRHHYSATATTGRGVGLLENLSDEWGWRPERDGKTVWFRVLRERSVWAPIDLTGLEGA
jgi:anti-sigma regulatory factor (Ser/Thr protein kinase)